MSESHSADTRRHWLRPLKGEWRAQRHLILWPEEEHHRGRVRARLTLAIDLAIARDGTIDRHDRPLPSVSALEEALDRATQGKGTLTVWLPSGWEHLVMTGLATLMDAGALTYRYCTLDANRVLIRGQWRARPIIITSLANWTGGTWDAWASKTDARGVQLMADSFVAIAQLSRILHTGTVAPSAGAGGMAFWRSSLGTVLRISKEAPSGGGRKRGGEGQAFVAPIPQRPKRAREAERHSCYGLVHRQLRRGQVDGPIYCVDVTSCYLLCLATTPLPMVFTKHLHRPAVTELLTELSGATGCALVLLRSPETPYPVRRGGRVHYATGEFWTWLAGAELAEALINSHVQLCECAYLWLGSRFTAPRIAGLLSLGDTLREEAGPLVAAAWRSLYSHFVGRMAGWRREWVDCEAPHNFGRWAAWLGVDADTGAYVQYRSVAGRCQCLAARADSSDSVPLFFACVTAQGRYLLRRLAEIAGWPNCLAIEADSVWLTKEGWQRLQRRASQEGIAPDLLRCKETFSRAWLTGQSIAVVEQGGKRYVRCPGIPADIAVGTRGKVHWTTGQEWAEEGGPDRAKGVKRKERTWDASRIVKEFSAPAVELPYADEITDPILGPELLEPLGERQATSEGS